MIKQARNYQKCSILKAGGVSRNTSGTKASDKSGRIESLERRNEIKRYCTECERGECYFDKGGE